MRVDSAVALVRRHLGPRWLKHPWTQEWSDDLPASWGCCYIACEAVRFMSDEHLVPHVMRLRNERYANGARAFGTHWYLRSKADGAIIDPTADQFLGPLDYRGVGKGFLTGDRLSKTAAALVGLCLDGELDVLFMDEPVAV